MPIPFLCEPLERRDQCAAGATLDAKYLFAAAAVKGIVGQAPPIFQALPGPGDRTYLLGVRDEKFVTEGIGRRGKLTIIAVGADGKPDASFGTGGVALTGRVISYLNRPGLIKLDGLGRIYYAESTRVVRLKADGSNDKTFGVNGAAEFAPASRPVLLCDIQPTDDGGVLVATTQTTDGTQRYAVQKIDRRVRTVWDSTYDSGGGGDVTGEYDDLAVGQAQFTAADGQVVLARTETTVTLVPDPSVDAMPGDVIAKTTRQDAVVTRFDAAGHGTDVARKEMRRPGNDLSAAIGTADYRYANVGNLLLQRGGRSLLVLTDQELLKFNLDTGSAKRSTLPGNYASNTVNRVPIYQLLADGGLGVYVGNYDKKGREITEINRFLPDGTLDRTLGDDGSLIVTRDDYVNVKKVGNVIDQLFLGPRSGRLYFISTGTVVGTPANLTLRRI